MSARNRTPGAVPHPFEAALPLRALFSVQGRGETIDIVLQQVEPPDIRLLLALRLVSEAAIIDLDVDYDRANRRARNFFPVAGFYPRRGRELLTMNWAALR